MINGIQGDEFVLDEDCGRNGPMAEDVDTDSDQVGTVSLREVGD